jgi:hypothetical protein
MRVRDTVHTQRISHVRDVVFRESSLVDLGHGTLMLHVGFGGCGETGFCEAALEDFHDAVGVCVAA